MMYRLTMHETSLTADISIAFIQHHLLSQTYNHLNLVFLHHHNLLVFLARSMLLKIATLLDRRLAGHTEALVRNLRTIYLLSPNLNK